MANGTDGDVLKHTVLGRVLRLAAARFREVRYLDPFAGEGLFAGSAEVQQRQLELGLGAHLEIQPYLPRWYLGSPLIAARALHSSPASDLILSDADQATVARLTAALSGTMPGGLLRPQDLVFRTIAAPQVRACTADSVTQALLPPAAVNVVFLDPPAAMGYRDLVTSIWEGIEQAGANVLLVLSQALDWDIGGALEERGVPTTTLNLGRDSVVLASAGWCRTELDSVIGEASAGWAPRSQDRGPMSPAAVVPFLRFLDAAWLGVPDPGWSAFRPVPPARWSFGLSATHLEIRKAPHAGVEVVGDETALAPTDRPRYSANIELARWTSLAITADRVDFLDAQGNPLAWLSRGLAPIKGPAGYRPKVGIRIGREQAPALHQVRTPRASHRVTIHYQEPTYAMHSGGSARTYQRSFDVCEPDEEAARNRAYWNFRAEANLSGVNWHRDIVSMTVEAL